MPDITPNTLALIAGTIAAALVVQPLPPAPVPALAPVVASVDPVADAGTGTVLKNDPVPVNPPTVEPDPALVAIAQQSVLLARLIGDEVQRTEPADAPVPLPWGRETRLPT